MLVWLTLVRVRRGELLALRWQNVDLPGGVLTIRHSLSERGSAAAVKDTKTHQMRRISLDEAPVELLAEHKKRTARNCDAIDAPFDEDAFVFSHAPDHQRPCSPSGVPHRYERMVHKLGIRTRLHSMRHYSATRYSADPPVPYIPDCLTQLISRSASGRVLLPTPGQLPGSLSMLVRRPGRPLRPIPVHEKLARPSTSGSSRLRVSITVG